MNSPQFVRNLPAVVIFANLPVFGLVAAATFWVFIGAAIANGLAARRDFLDRSRDPVPSLLGRSPWFVAGLVAFCLLVAFEEISWGQRLIGYRPPAYFLAENYQQELNFHNTLGDRLREVGFLGVCWGYGVLLPVVNAWPVTRGWLTRLAVVVPAPGLVPSFVATALLYQIYPWSHSGEWSEAMLGTTMLFAALVHLYKDAETPRSRLGSGLGRAIILAWLATGMLGALTATLGRREAGDESPRIREAAAELEALRSDLGAARARTRCGVHKRIYTMVETYGQDQLLSGSFASLVRQGLPEERARFFLDPWNSPYWILHMCSEDHRRRAVFVYSFGPNRRRESTDWEILGDDVGAWISRPRQSAGD